MSQGLAEVFVSMFLNPGTASRSRVTHEQSQFTYVLMHYRSWDGGGAFVLAVLLAVLGALARGAA